MEELHSIGIHPHRQGLEEGDKVNGQFQHIYTDICCHVPFPVPAPSQDILTPSDALHLVQVILNAYIKAESYLNKVFDTVCICSKYNQNINALPINTYNVIFGSAKKISSF